ncbi:hypothetical protein FRC02_004626 [Tulasnella sp. 418]|nr:hypothetical protein FRC02_004626 [Tulasnella sp. 418]
MFRYKLGSSHPLGLFLSYDYTLFRNHPAFYRSATVRHQSSNIKTLDSQSLGLSAGNSSVNSFDRSFHVYGMESKSRHFGMVLATRAVGQLLSMA